MVTEYVRYFPAGDRLMRRVVFLVMGLLELGVAAVLVAFAWQLPARSEVDQTFDRAERVTGRTGSQVKLFREQVHDLRRPELQDLGRQLQDQTKTVTGTLKSQTVDFDRLQTVGDALGDVAGGLDGLGETSRRRQPGEDGRGARGDRVVPRPAGGADRRPGRRPARPIDRRPVRGRPQAQCPACGRRRPT